MPKKNTNKHAKTIGICTREVTINLHKRLNKVAFKKRAPRAIKEVKEFARKQMGTDDVRIDVRLNAFLWSQGIRHVPFRARIRMARKTNQDEEAKSRFYTLCTIVPTVDFKGLVTQVVSD